VIEDLRKSYAIAKAQAAGELDTWRCPRCLSEAVYSGDVHIEWGSPECFPCGVADQRVEMDLVAVAKQRQN